MTTKLIPQRYFEELKNRGNTVPRNEQTGDVLPFKVGAIYNIGYTKDGETVTAKCTQDCPYNLRLLKAEEMESYYIYHDKILKKIFTDQPTDEHVFGWLLRNQSNSVHRALNVEGWKVEVKNKETGIVTNYNDGKEISDPLCNRLTDEL